MKKNVENPIILLLGTPLEYERVQYKLSSLDQVIILSSKTSIHPYCF